MAVSLSAVLYPNKSITALGLRGGIFFLKESEATPVPVAEEPSELDQFSDYYQDLLNGSYNCLDRIVLNGYFPLVQTPGGCGCSGADGKG